MTDSTGGASAAPPKKRSFFTKAAWQTKPKSESEDIFSHSNEFKDIAAAEARQREEKRRLKEEEKRKITETQERKRRKLSSEEEDIKLPDSGVGSSGRTSRKESARSKTPASPLRGESPAPIDIKTDSLTSRYNSLTRASSSKSAKEEESNIIDLGSSDSDPDDSPYNPPKFTTTKPTTAQLLTKPQPTKPLPTYDLEEIEDPYLAQLAAKARAKAANNASASKPGTSASSTGHIEAPVIVQLFITSVDPTLKPLLVNIKASSTLELVRLSYCKMQGRSEDWTRRVYLTWKRQMVYDSTTVKRLGVKVDASGIVSVEGSEDIYGDDNLPRIHLEAWTAELEREWKQQEEAAKVAEAAARAAAAPPLPSFEEEPEEEAQAPETRIKLILKTRGKPDFKIVVKPDTTIEHLTVAYKEKYAAAGDEPITLMFDGERLRPMDTISSYDIEDMDALEVHFK